MADGPINKVTVAGRDVYLKTGAQTKTVNVCTAENREGLYEVRYRLDVAAPLELDDLTQLPDLASLAARLDELGDPETPSGGPGSGLAPLIDDDVDEHWLESAVQATERAIDRLVEQFAAEPYRHRVEHSLHVELVHLLREEELLAAPALLGSGDATQLVHKEWPEAEPRPEKKGLRGLSDVVVLAPGQLAQASRRHFLQGRVRPAIVIEVGLDYALDHLQGDIGKLVNSNVRHGYLVHFTRVGVADPVALEAQLCDTTRGYRAAYVHHPPTGPVRRKTVRSDGVEHVRPLSPPASTAGHP